MSKSICVYRGLTKEISLEGKTSRMNMMHTYSFNNLIKVTLHQMCKVNIRNLYGMI